MKDLLKSIILLVLVTLAMISQLSQDYHTRLADLDLNTFILQKEIIRKEFIGLVFEIFNIDFKDKGLDAEISTVTNRATRYMPQSVRDCLESERFRIEGQSLNEILYRTIRILDLGVDKFVLKEEKVRRELILLVFKQFDIDFNKGMDATLYSLTNVTVRSMPRKVRECLASEILRMKGQNVDDILLLSKTNDDENFDA